MSEDVPTAISRGGSVAFEHLSELRGIGSAAPTRKACKSYLERHAAANADLADAECILAELISNVIRHANGSASFRITWEGTHPQLLVLDDGPGHPPECLSTLADPFAESGRGIALIRALAVDVDFGNNAHGGSYFRVTLPVLRRARTDQTEGHTAGKP